MLFWFTYTRGYFISCTTKAYNEFYPLTLFSINCYVMFIKQLRCFINDFYPFNWYFRRTILIPNNAQYTILSCLRDIRHRQRYRSAKFTTAGVGIVWTWGRDESNHSSATELLHTYLNAQEKLQITVNTLVSCHYVTKYFNVFYFQNWQI